MSSGIYGRRQSPYSERLVGAVPDVVSPSRAPCLLISRPSCLEGVSASERSSRRAGLASRKGGGCRCPSFQNRAATAGFLGMCRTDKDERASGSYCCKRLYPFEPLMCSRPSVSRGGNNTRISSPHFWATTSLTPEVKNRSPRICTADAPAQSYCYRFPVSKHTSSPHSELFDAPRRGAAVCIKAPAPGLPLS
jgi:hypothetical protein